MSSSPEFNVHTSLLHENLCALLEESAVTINEGRMVAAGLLNRRSDGNDGYFRPRLVVISGMSGVIRRIIGQSVRDDVMVIGAAKQDDPTTTIGRVYATCPGTARDILKGMDLDDGQISKLSQSIRTAERETLSLDDAKLYHQRISEQLGQLIATNPRPVSY